MKFELQTLDEYSDDTLLAEVHRVVEVLNGQRLTRERFDSLARVHSSTLSNHFGSWTATLDKAGISESIAPRARLLNREQIIKALRDFATENPGVSVTQDAFAERLGISRGNRWLRKWDTLLSEVGIFQVPLGRRYSDEECFENILALWTHYGRQPRFSELKRPPSAVGPKAYIRRWGGWRAALSAFVKKVNEVAAAPIEQNPIETSQETQIGAATGVPAPREISLALRYKILSRDRFRCVICGASPAKDVMVELHVDHIYPWSRGGQNLEENLRTLCFKCNLGKGARIEESHNTPS